MRTLEATPGRVAVVTRWARLFDVPASLENSAAAVQRGKAARLKFPSTQTGCFFCHLLEQVPEEEGSVVSDGEPLPAVLPLLRNNPAALSGDSGGVFILENLDLVRLAFRTEPDIRRSRVGSSMVGGVRIWPLSPLWAACATTLLTAAAVGELHDLYRSDLD